MKVTFVHLGRENLGIEYLSAVLKSQGYCVSLAYDPGLFSLNDNVLYIPFLERLFSRRQWVLEQIQLSHPDVVAFSVYTGTYVWALEIARELKARLGVSTVFGGIHPTLVPTEVVKQSEVDFVIVGEAEEAFPELLEHIEKNQPPKGVSNVWYKAGNKIASHPVRHPIQDLDDIPLPDKSLFEKEVNYRDDYMILSSRGCPYRCTYCCESYWNRLYKGRYFRRRSVNSVIEELKRMKEKYGFREVMFNDPIFFTDRTWLQKLMVCYRKEIKAPFRCFGRVDFLDQEMAELLQWGGCYAIEFGLQSFNPEIRKRTLRRQETNAHYENAFRILDRLGIRYDIDHMFGLPGESIQDHVDVARFYSGLGRLNRIKCHNLTYFPGLEILEKGREAKMLTLDDEKAISCGEMPSDFFHQDAIKDRALKEAATDFQTLFKVLPVIPGNLLEKILKRSQWQGWHRIPSLFVILGQMAVALRGHDYRFFLYFRYYSLRIRRALRVLPRLKASLITVFYGFTALATIPLGNHIKDWGALHVSGICLGGMALWWLLRGWRKNIDT